SREFDMGWERNRPSEMAACGLVTLTLLPLLLALFRPFFGTFAVPGVALRLEHVRARHKGAHFAEPGHHLHALPDRHFRHLPHQGADPLELGEKLLDLVRLDAGAGRDPPPPA